MTTLVLEPLTQDNYAEWGRCREIGPEIFFSEVSENGGADKSFVDRAKAVCGRCEVMEFCRAEALLLDRGKKSNELFGVVGGMTAKERAVHTSQWCRGCKAQPRRGRRKSLCEDCIAAGVTLDDD